MHYIKSNDPVEVSIKNSKRKIVRSKYTSANAVLKVYFERYKDYTGYDYSISPTKKKQILYKISEFEKDKEINVDQHCEIVGYLFDYVFKPGFEPSLGSLISDYFFNLWRSKSSARRGKFRKTSKKEFEKKVRKSYKGNLGTKIEALKKNGIAK